MKKVKKNRRKKLQIIYVTRVQQLEYTGGTYTAIIKQQPVKHMDEGSAETSLQQLVISLSPNPRLHKQRGMFWGGMGGL
jgi:hypothetical protein